MIELLVVLCILLSASILYLPKNIHFDFRDYHFGNEYNYLKSEALLKRQSTPLLNDYDLELLYPIYFSGNGNINKAQTIKGHKYQLIAHLGNGYLTYEK